LGLVEEALAARRVRGLPVEDFATVLTDVGDVGGAELVAARESWRRALRQAPVGILEEDDARVLTLEVPPNATAEQYAAGLVEAHGILLGVRGPFLVISLSTAPELARRACPRVAAFFVTHAWGC